MRTTNRQLVYDGDEGPGAKLDRESRLLFTMRSCPLVPIGLFWMAWTCYPSTCHDWCGHHIDLPECLHVHYRGIAAYEVCAASALTFVTLVRYLAAGGMTVVGVPMYENLGTHYTLKTLASISAAAVPIPYVLYRWGPNLRQKSKYAQ